MKPIEEGTLLWEPDANRKQQTNIYHYMTWLAKHKQLDFSDYHSLWQWSVSEIEAFWESIWDYFDIQSGTPYSQRIPCQVPDGFQGQPSIILNIFFATAI